ncbi:hypothetical protein RvY_15722 [Ramazzottius varieornatus]|uniref:Cytochrome P450 n=1 Tax=Ramazzottius varieornatus TaxID=947166 RepID=A0A1D1VVY2_RAMVA|nr:hypothetical protein RvY_15722 [Ramazzottius varieornatus]
MNEQQGRPVDVRMKLNTAVSAVVSTVLFGQNYKHNEADFANVADTFRGIGGAAAMNYWLWLRYLPPYSKAYQQQIEAMHSNFNVFRAIIAKEKKDNPENRHNNFIAAYLARRKELQNERFTDHQLVLTLSDVFPAGFETTATTLRWALLCMCENPEIQKKLHAEIDREVGRERPPQLDDRDKLPWTEATLLEVQRIAIIAPTSKRVCPGEPLARMELSLFFTALLQKFRFELQPGTKADLRPRCGLTNDTRPFVLCAHPR